MLDVRAKAPQCSRVALRDDIQQLGEIAIFRQLEPDALRLLAFSAETKILSAGDVLFREGAVSDGAFFVTRGRLALRATRDPAPTSVAAPALLGAIALLTETRRPATATASEPSTVRVVTRALFARVLTESPEAAAKIRLLILAQMHELVADLARFAKGGSDRGA